MNEDIKIESEDDLLVALCKYSDENSECRLYEFMTNFPMDGFLLNKYFSALQDKGYVIQTSTDYALITPDGYSRANEIEKPSVLIVSKKSMDIVRDLIIGIVVAIIAGFLLWVVGWN